MKTIFLTFAVLAVLAICQGSNAKVFDDQHMPKSPNQLRNGDSFSVECRNNRTGVIDRESVDVDSATVTVEIPGREPIVHRITEFNVMGRRVQDRFGQVSVEFYVQMANWGRIGGIGVGLMIPDQYSTRWYSHHEDDTFWTCAD